MEQGRERDHLLLLLQLKPSSKISILEFRKQILSKGSAPIYDYS